MTTTTSNRFPPVSATTATTEILDLLKSPEKAIAFAIEHIEEFEVRAFLMDWSLGADLTPWAEAWRVDYEVGKGTPRG